LIRVYTLALSLHNIVMRALSHAMPVFAPIKVAKKLPYTPKPVAEPIQSQPLKANATKPSGLWENKSFSFWDILDAINPLQHIPIISTIYRKITGDEMGYASRIAGDTLYGGLFGSLISSLVSAVANVFVDSTTGKDIGEHMMASISPSPPQNYKVNAATTAPLTLTATKLQHNNPQAIPFSVPTSAMLATEIIQLPPIDPSRVQAGIDQYKWQIMADEIKTRTNNWA